MFYLKQLTKKNLKMLVTTKLIKKSASSSTGTSWVSSDYRQQIEPTNNKSSNNLFNRFVRTVTGKTKASEEEEEASKNLALTLRNWEKSANQTDDSWILVDRNGLVIRQSSEQNHNVNFFYILLSLA